jgi:enoyl-CoA hydratase/carnithine racemase
MRFIRVQFDGAIARVVLDHSGGNRINFVMRAELLDAFEQVATSSARVLIVQAEGTNFCLGGDVREWPGIPAAELRPRVEVFGKALDRLEQLKIPTVAAVQGGCFGGGFELALNCDLIVAGRSARFAFPEAQVGILTLQAGILQLAELIGRTKAIELVFLSERVTAEQMAAWNVVNRVVDDADLAAEVEALSNRLATGATNAYASTKALLNLWRFEGLRSAKARLYELSMPLFDSEDVQIALRNAAEAINAGMPLPEATFTRLKN